MVIAGRVCQRGFLTPSSNKRPLSSDLLGLFSLEKRWLRRGTITVFKYINWLEVNCSLCLLQIAPESHAQIVREVYVKYYDSSDQRQMSLMESSPPQLLNSDSLCSQLQDRGAFRGKYIWPNLGDSAEWRELDPRNDYVFLLTSKDTSSHVDMPIRNIYLYPD